MNENELAVKELIHKRVSPFIDDLVGFVLDTFGQFGIKALRNEFEKSRVDVSCTTGSYTGERRDMVKLYGCVDWKDLIRRISTGSAGLDIKPCDYFYMPVCAPAAKACSVEYRDIDIGLTKVVVTHVFDDKVIFNFEDVLFYGAMSDENTNKGGFAKTALCKYLNENFINVFTGVDDCLIKNKDGNKISLPTEFEVFGARTKSCNWTEAAQQLDFFKDVKNRIRPKDNDTEWWWLSSPYASSTANFCGVSGSGSAYYSCASSTCGVAPCFCISANLKLPPLCGAGKEEE
jgi:hypothetical protein